MKLCAITVQKVIGFIVLAPMAFLVTDATFFYMFSWITGGTVVDVKLMFTMLGFTVFGDFLVFCITYPGFYDSMDAVKGRMSYRELKKCIRNEVFEKPIQFWDKKYKRKESYLYVSKNWVCVNGNLCNNKRNPVCIPREILSDYYIHLGVKAPRSAALDLYSDTIVLTIYTTTGYKISTGYIKSEEIEEIESILEQKVPEFSRNSKIHDMWTGEN